MKSQGCKPKQVLTLLGPIGFSRSLFLCPKCHRTRFPGDEELAIVHTSRSPGVRRLVGHFAAKEPFKEVSNDMAIAAGISLSPKDAERIAETLGKQMEAWANAERTHLRFQEPPPPDAPKTIPTLYVEYDGTGVPMVRREVAGRKGKQGDGSAKTREAKIGCVFTQTIQDQNGRPIRDPSSTSYVGAIEDCHTFGARIFGEAVRRGLYDAVRVVALGDGAAWIQNLAATQFGQAQFIVDLYHAREHLTTLCHALFGQGTLPAQRYRDTWSGLLDEGAIEAILEQAQAFLPQDPKGKPDARRELAYFEKNKAYMRYGKFRAQGLFVGSGVVEAACKNVAGKRLKQSGMEWSVAGANAILSLRCTVLSGRAEDFWETRAA